MPKNEYVRFKNYERKKSPFMICADIESILVPEDNEKQKTNESYTNKYQKLLLLLVTVTCSYGYKLVCVNDKFSHTQAKMLFTILLIVWLKKESNLGM